MINYIYLIVGIILFISSIPVMFNSHLAKGYSNLKQTKEQLKKRQQFLVVSLLIYGITLLSFYFIGCSNIFPFIIISISFVFFLPIMSFLYDKKNK